MERKPIRTGYKNGSPTKHYEQSDMKTSVFIQTLIKDPATNSRISIFLLEQITSICDGLDQYNETLHFNSYIQLLRGLDLDITDTNKQNELQMKRANEGSKIPIAYTDQYIAGWSRASTFDATSSSFRQNALAMYQYSKFTHILIFSESNFNIFFRVFLDIFQQNNFYFLSKLRGHRVDLNNDRDNPPLDNHIGISTFAYDYLLHKYTNDAGIKVDVPSWRHDGEVSCSIAYDNYYNNKKKLERLKNSYHGSLQCGISGSQQYIVFAFLLSIIHRRSKLTKDDMDAACKNIFILSCMYLVGMGGHNIQEVLLGLTSSIIMLHTAFKNIIKNLGSILGANGSYDRTKINAYYSNSPNTDLIKNIISFCFTLNYTDDSYDKPTTYNDDFKYSLAEATIHMVRECKPFVDYFYHLTTHVNVTGIFGNEINNIYFHSSKTINYSTNSYDDSDVRLKKMKQQFIDNYFKPQNMTDQQFQIFFSLEGNRYLLPPDDSFNLAANNFLDLMTDFPIVQSFVNNPGITLNNIPFSFNSSPKRKSNKKSPKRKSRK